MIYLFLLLRCIDVDENAGAVGGGQLCNVMLQSETGEDKQCGIPCQPDHDGLCELVFCN